MTTNLTRRRAGLTLLEVVVSMAIFLMSLAAIYQLSNIGGERAIEVAQRTRTSLRCQGKLAEIMIGAETNTSATYANFEDADKDLMWKAEIADDTMVGLKVATVWVKIDMQGGKKVESRLTQKFLDPNIRGTTFDVPNPPPTPGTPTKDAETTPDSGTTTPSTTPTPPSSGATGGRPSGTTGGATGGRPGGTGGGATGGRPGNTGGGGGTNGNGGGNPPPAGGTNGNGGGNPPPAGGM